MADLVNNRELPSRAAMQLECTMMVVERSLSIKWSSFQYLK